MGPLRTCTSRVGHMSGHSTNTAPFDLAEFLQSRTLSVCVEATAHFRVTKHNRCLCASELINISMTVAGWGGVGVGGGQVTSIGGGG